MLSTRQLFGTDGIRGLANKAPITPEMMLQVAMAVAAKFCDKNHRHTAIIGKDTRLSGYMIETSLTAGFVAMGMDVSLLGPIPTPSVAMLTRSMRADLGVMISASHNLFEDNGVKFFGPDGYKLSDATEFEIEAILNKGQYDVALPHDIGKVRRLDDAGGRYVEFVKSTLPRQLRLDGIKIVIDCANGAAYKVAPQILWELGATLIHIGTQPDGTNINAGCGATSPKLMAETVVKSKAHLGISLDGDADRLIMADEKGTIVSGDHLMAILAKSMHEQGLLTHNTVVATQMSNLGFERFLKGRGINLIRTDVGDRYVIEAMQQHGYTLGGEQSGHLILSDYSSTGDGLLSALQILRIFIERQKPFSELATVFSSVPQLLRNVRVSERELLNQTTIVNAIEVAKQKLETNQGRLLVRFSGTEPLLRLMGEADDLAALTKIIDDLEQVIVKAS
ncbi:phosphoglucosamine mutase [Candidatus Paracaedibacter symbiosus]|uniref:phosphoglucosamine mutase n=1 Tax=Candidatus Paracaedibacter symbiosus TaxID=244582 RepID=UPI000509F4A2|nr:phosphoglucosamine mutase [Candidatus Paracaedibacter symbiosus]